MAAELEELERKLLDRAMPMPVRFRALFALRGLGGDAVRAAFAEGASLFGATSPLHARKRSVAPALRFGLRLHGAHGWHTLAWTAGETPLDIAAAATSHPARLTGD
jgi:hypothetical protein